MDELLTMVRQLIEKVDHLETSINELKEQQRPLSSKDYLHSLQGENAKELEEWIQQLELLPEHVYSILEEKNYLPMLKKINFEASMRIFDNNKNTVFCFTEGKWKTMTKQNIDKLQNALFNKIHKQYCALKKDSTSLLYQPPIKDLSYIEQRDLINLITKTTHTKFKTEIYRRLQQPEE